MQPRPELRTSALTTLGCALALAVSIAAAPAPASAQGIGLLPAQGTLYAADGRPYEGTQSVRFALYTSSVGGTPAWSEVQTVTFTNGLFSTYLGSITRIPTSLYSTSAQLWLGVRVGTDSEMPLIAVGTVPWAGYAGVSANSSLLAGFNVDELVAQATAAAAERFQARIASPCAAGTVMSSVAPDGTVTCVAQPTGVPLGAVIDWWRPDSTFPLPAGFVICDGAFVGDPASPYFGQRLPDLRNVFVRGAATPAEIGATGGSDTVQVDVTLPGHAHAHTHDHPGMELQTGDSGPHSHVWSVQNGTGWQSGDGQVMVGVPTFDGGGTAAVPLNQLESQPNTTFRTSSESAHRHTVSVDVPNHTGTTEVSGAATVTSASGSNVPRYVGLLKIMRIR